uniref:PEP-utilising enzyme mobile domain-containing protein n=1 Tax=Ditylenchus dipsaci TaxID=166011 RepID=A0A915D5T2_9BILA
MLPIHLAMLLRGSAEGDLTPDLLSDIATIYSNNLLKVVSADLPESLKALLNNMSDGAQEHQDTMEKHSKGSLDEVFDQLKCKLTSRQRFGLKMLIPHAIEGFGLRLLPDPELIFFMTIQEINQLIRLKESSALVSRSRRRRRILESQALRKYALLNFGTPDPSESIILQNTDLSSLSLELVSLKEAENTKPGEILITKYTDIGWSPLFPIIRGLVTEIGGLLSHGAVVAREQGLPCLISVQNATDIFQTGDEVVLDATHGTVGLIKKEE